MQDSPKPPTSEPVGAPQPAPANPSKCILVVEDDGNIRRFNTYALVHHGYQVDAVEDGAVAWDALQRNRYDLMITDNNMPRLSGVELLKKVHDARMTMPVILATGAVPQEELSRNPRLQPAATLLKPYSLAQLLGAVREILGAVGGCDQVVSPPTSGGR